MSAARLQGKAKFETLLAGQATLLPQEKNRILDYSRSPPPGTLTLEWDEVLKVVSDDLEVNALCSFKNIKDTKRRIMIMLFLGKCITKISNSNAGQLGQNFGQEEMMEIVEEESGEMPFGRFDIFQKGTESFFTRIIEPQSRHLFLKNLFSVFYSSRSAASAVEKILNF